MKLSLSVASSDTVFKLGFIFLRIIIVIVASIFFVAGILFGIQIRGLVFWEFFRTAVCLAVGLSLFYLALILETKN